MPIRSPLSPLRTLALATIFLVSPRRAETVEIVRDAVGVPHIFASTAKGAFYGLGYAAAQDRLFQMEFSRRLMRGRLAEILGDRALLLDERARFVGFARHVDALIPTIRDPELLAALDAYCRGVNDYASSLGGKLPSVFRHVQLDTFEPWTPADCLLVWYRFHDLFDHAWERQLVGAAVQDVEASNVDPGGAVLQCEGATSRPASAPGIPASAPSAPASSPSNSPGGGAQSQPSPRVEPPVDAPPETSPKPPSDGLLLASHAWAVAGSRTTTGAALLVSEPRIELVAPSIFHEFRLRGGPYDCRGIGLAGCPGLVIGWNRKIAWGATALPVAGSDLYRLTTSPAAKGSYLVEGKLRPFTNLRTETIRVKGRGDIKFECRDAEWGPVVTPYLRDGELLPRSDPNEYAVRHVLLEEKGSHTLQASLGLMRATGWSEAREALRAWRGPALHFIYADAAGHIGYISLATIPIRTDADRPSAGRAPRDGSVSTPQWLGIVPFDELPSAFDPPSGFLSAANNLAIDPACAPYKMIIGKPGDTPRSWRLREILSAKLAAPESKVTPEEIFAIHTDAVDPRLRVTARLAAEALAQGFLTAGSGAAKAAEALSHWNDGLPKEKQWSFLTTNPNYLLVSAVEQSLGTFRRGFDGGTLFVGGEAGSCRALREADRDPRTFIQRTDARAWLSVALDAAWQNATRMGYGLTAGRERLSRNLVPPVRIPYQENFLRLLDPPASSFGTWSLDPMREPKVASAAPCPSVSTIWSQPYGAYTQLVDFSNLDGARAILPPGNSEDPASPFFDNQLRFWLYGAVRPAPLEESRVRASAASKSLQLEFR